MTTETFPAYVASREPAVLDGSETVAVVKNGVTEKTTTADIAAAAGNSGVTPGAYTNANVTVNAKGIVTAASNGGGGGTPTAYGRVLADGTLFGVVPQGVDSVDHLATGVYQINFTPGFFSSAPVVVLGVEDQGIFGGPTGKLIWVNESLFSELFCVVTIANTSLVAQDSIFRFIATGPA